MENKNNRVSPLATATATIGGNEVTINYSSPGVKSREGKIWGTLVPYNEVWRTGANEATTISFSKNVLVEGQPLAKDIYSFFTIPTPDEWTVIFNVHETQWGAFKYDQSEDALRVKTTPVMLPESTENLVFHILPDSLPNSGIIRMNWEKLQFDVHFVNDAAQ